MPRQQERWRWSRNKGTMMQIFGWHIERVKRKATLGDIQKARGSSATLWGEGSAWAPANYGNYYAQSVPAYRAIKLRADAVASAPLRVYRRLPDGGQEYVGPEHPVQVLLDKVNPWWTHADLLKATETNLCLWGSAYWFMDKQGGQVTIWPLRPDMMRVIPDRGGGATAYIKGFIYQAEGGVRIPLTRDEVIWFRYYNPLDEYAGLSPLAAARLTLDMGRNALRFNAAFFEGGAVPQDVIYPVQGPVTDEEIEDFYRRLEKRHGGPARAHRPMVVDLSVMGKPERLGFTQRDMEFLASLNFTVEDAARVWGVPPPKMYSQAQSTYNNVKQADMEFYSDTISVEWRFLEAEITEMLLPSLKEPDLFVAFDTSNVLSLQEALTELHNRDRQDVTAGILTINEVRANRHLEPVAWGDQFWGPLTLAPVGEESGLFSPPPLPLDTAGQELLPGMRSLGGNGKGHRNRAFKSVGKLDRILELFQRRLDPQIRQFLSLQKLIFDAQRRDVLEKLLATRSLTRQMGDIFDIAEWTVRSKARGLPLVMRIFVSAAADHAADWGLGPFNSERETVRGWVAKRVAFWADSVNVETGKLLMAELEEGAKLGEGIPDLALRVEKAFNFNNVVRAERIARTETLAASNAGHLEVYRQSGIVDEKVWLTAQDERVREAHAVAHGQTVAADQDFFVGGEYLEAPGIGGSPENVINCILPGNRVMASGISAASVGYYKGSALELTTKNGRILTVTPNHPVLTWEGWKSAQLLHPGDYLVCGNFQQGMVSVNEDEQYMPPRIEQVYSALNVIAGAATAARNGIADFHGDGRFMQGNIQVVEAYGELWCACGTPGLEPIHQDHFGFNSVLPGALPGFGSEAQFIPTSSLTSHGGMGGVSQPLAVLGSSSSHTGKHAVATIPRLDSMFQEAAADHRAAYTISQGERLLGFTASIVLDKLVDIRDFNFTGHVYDLQSWLGSLYIANGIFVHNCRCTVNPVIRRKTLPVLLARQKVGPLSS